MVNAGNRWHPWKGHGWEFHERVIYRNANRCRDSRRGGEASQTQQEDGGLGEGEVPRTQGECGSWSRGYPPGVMTFGRRSLPVQRRWMERERERERRIWILTFLSCQFPLIGRTQTEARGLKSPSDGVVCGEQLPWCWDHGLTFLALDICYTCIGEKKDISMVFRWVESILVSWGVLSDVFPN